MHTISVRQPWTWLIVQGHKKIEYRSRNTNHRGLLLIHASQTLDKKTVFDALNYAESIGVHIPDELDAGGIVGCVELHTVQQTSSDYEYHLRNPVALPLIECSGKLGIWQYPGLTADQVALIVRRDVVTVRANARAHNLGIKHGRDWLFDTPDVEILKSLHPGRPRK